MAGPRNENTLTDNFKANVVFLAISWILIILLAIFGILDFDINKLGHSSNVLTHLLVFSVTYFFVSLWCSPDMDQHVNRPGKHSFPFSRILKILRKIKKRGRLLGGLLVVPELLIQSAHIVVNRIWYFLWHPFGMAFTHRGVIHWPIVGAQIRILYLFIFYWFAGLALPLPLTGDNLFLNIYDLYECFFSNPLAMTAFVAVIASDICHSAIDYYDTVRNGSASFVPPVNIAPRGWFLKFFQFIRGNLFG